MLNEAAFSEIEQTLEPLLLAEGADLEVGILLESLDSAPYALEKKVVKGKGDISYIFADETGDRYRIQFLTGAKLGKGVAKVYIGKAKSEKLFVDKIDRFANPRAMISTITSLFAEHLLTPEGMGLRGFVVDLSGAASIRAIPLMKKVINSTLRSKVKVVDGEYDPVPNRKYIWVTKATLKPAEVFNGEGVGEDAPWMKGVERKGSQATITGKDGKAVSFDPMDTLQELANEVTVKLKGKYPKIEIRPSYNSQGKVGMLTPYIQGSPVAQSAIYALATLKAGPDSAAEAKAITANIQVADDLKAKKLAEIQEEKKRQNKLATDPLFYLNAMKPELEKQINRVYPNLNVSVSFKDPSREYNLAKVVLSIDGVKVGDASVLLFGEEPAKAMESIRASIRKDDWARAIKEVSDSKIKSTTQNADGKVVKALDNNAKKLIDVGMKGVKEIMEGRYLASTSNGKFVFSMNGAGEVTAVSSEDGRYTDDRPSSGWGMDILKELKNKDAYWLGRANLDKGDLANAVMRGVSAKVGQLNDKARGMGLKLGFMAKTYTNDSFVIKQSIGDSTNSKEFMLTAIYNWNRSKFDMDQDIAIRNVQDGSLYANLNDTASIMGPVNTVEPFVERLVGLYSDFIKEIEKTKQTAKAPPASTKQIVRAKYRDPHGYYIIVSYNQNINRVFVKDEGGTSYAASRVMFMHPNKGTAELTSMFTDAVLSGEPSNSTELVKILSKATRLPRWETA